ncbi:MAG: hypothetical protein ACFFDC_11470 [Promethearchaeota archaeon]
MSQKKSIQTRSREEVIRFSMILFRGLISCVAAVFFALVGPMYLFSELFAGHSLDLGVFIVFEIIVLLFSFLMAFLGYFWISEARNEWKTIQESQNKKISIKPIN